MNSQRLFLGPYLRFNVPAERMDDPPIPAEGQPSGEFHDPELLILYDQEREIKLCYMPISRAAGFEPPRLLYLSSERIHGWEIDLLGVDPQKEIDWFRRTYAKPIAELETVLELKAEYGWGMFAWVRHHHEHL